MSHVAQIIRNLMPASHYLDAFNNHVSYDAGIYYSLKPGLIILAFAALAPLVIYRLKTRLRGAG